MLQQSTALERLRLTINAVLDELQVQAARNDEQDHRLYELELWKAEVEQERNWMVSQRRYLQHVESEKQDMEEKVRFYEDGM
jgi:hypothetical protein